MLDRFVRWNLDFDGDLYGDDERERLRWYEGIATAASLQWTALPWAAAVLVLALGLPAVVPTLVMLGVLLIPMVLSTWYVRHSRVETVPRRWGGKRMVLSTLAGLPWVVYGLAAIQQWRPETDMATGGVVGAVIGGLIGLAMTYRQMLQRRKRDAALARDED